MKFAKYLLAAAALAAAPAMVHAQGAAEVELNAGATVMGNDDAPVGTIVSADANAVVVDTGTHQVPLPPSAFGQSETGPTVNITKAQLDEMYAQQLAEAEAALQAALVVGAPVITADNQSLGMVDEIVEAEGNVIIKAEDEQLVTLPVDMLALDPNGSIMALANLADIQAALEAQAGG